MKELTLVYFWMLFVTVAGCSSTNTQTRFDISDPADQQAMWAARKPLRLHLVSGDSLEIRRPRLEGDSLLFFLVDAEGETGNSPQAVPVDSIDAILETPGVPIGKQVGIMIVILGIGFWTLVFYAMSQYSWNQKE